MSKMPVRPSAKGHEDLWIPQNCRLNRPQSAPALSCSKSIKDEPQQVTTIKATEKQSAQLKGSSSTSAASSGVLDKTRLHRAKDSHRSFRRTAAPVKTIRPTSLWEGTHVLPSTPLSRSQSATRFDTRWRACGTYAHLADSTSTPAGRARVEQIHEMLKEKYSRQASSNLYHAYRKMAHYSNAVDPHSRCVYPRHFAHFLGELGVSVTAREACQLLRKEPTAANLAKPFGAATLYAMVAKAES